MIDNNYSLIGYLAALLTTFSGIPQIIRVYRLKESEGHIPMDGFFPIRRDSPLGYSWIIISDIPVIACKRGIFPVVGINALSGYPI